MEPEKEVSFFKLIRELNRGKIRYLIIGQRAVILYGGPVLTADTDLWTHPEDKKRVLSLLLDKLGLEISHTPDTKKTIVSAFSGLRKFDLFSQRSVRNVDHATIGFEDCYENSILKKDSKEDLSFRIPSIDDLIRLKKIQPPNVKDGQDIECLLKAKRLFKESNRS